MPQYEDGATPLNFPVTGASAVASTAGQYLGFTARESTGVTGVAVVIYDNTNAANGPILESFTLGAGQSSGDNYDRPGRKYKNGLYVSITGGGQLQGSVFT